jgi:hypothetical protein
MAIHHKVAWVVSVCVVGLGGGSVMGEDPPTAGELAQMVLDARRAIVRGHFEIDNRTEKPTANGLRKSRTQCTVYFDGEKYRLDRLQFGEGESVEFRHSIAFDGQRYWRFNFDRSMVGSVPGPGIAAVYGPDNPEYKRQDFNDPRDIGLSTRLFHFGGKHRVGGLFPSNEVRNALVVPDEIDGRRCWKMKFDWALLDGETWIDAERKNPIRIRFQSKPGSGDTSECVMEIQLGLQPGSGTWFPVGYEQRQTINGSSIFDHGRIRVVSVNEPISSEVFTLAGMNVPKGSVVHRYDLAVPIGQYSWNGREMVVEGALQSTHLASRWSQTVLSLVSIFAAMVAAGCLWFLLRRKAAPGR